MNRLVFVGLAALVTTASAQSKVLKWMDGPPGLPSGAKFAVVSGDPAKDGPFTIRARFPANYAVPAHHHPTDERVAVRSGGQLSYGMGDKISREKAATLGKGYHVVMPAAMNHWVFNTEPVEIEVSGKGPFAITYVDPKDDPRSK